jgi:chorismate mutase
MANQQFTDAIALLKADHRKVEGLFDQFEEARDPSRKQAIVNQICTELKVHMMI